VANGNKIIDLHKAVETAKVEQNQLTQELNFIMTQQKDLEESLLPLEKQIDTSELFLNSDKQDTYKMAETINSQLQQMGEDLKEIIEGINEKVATNDQDDPIATIGRILNCHTNSLNWIHKSTNDLQDKIDQVSRAHSNYKDYAGVVTYT